MKLTPDLLRAATGCQEAYAELYANPLSDACEWHGINTPARLAAFLAQIGHESAGFRFVREVWGPTPAQQRYEGRADLGNTQPGDGLRYCGRGLIQLTGRANYVRIRDRMRGVFPDVPDFEAQPEQLERPQWACLSAAEYWAGAGLNRLADAGDFEAITKRINGGLNGQADRLARWERAKQAMPENDAPGSPTAADLEPTAPTPSPIQKAAPMPSFSDVVRNPATAGLLSLVNPLLGLVPSIAKLFMDGAKTVPERNVAVAVAVAEAAQKALADAGRPVENMQQVVEAIATDPSAREIVKAGIVADCGHLVEAGGGGIEGARKADAEARSRADMLSSPSWWVAVLMLPLVYIIVGSLVGLWGTAQWSDEVRASLATAVISLIIGGAAGYFWGQTTSRNRAPT